MSLKKVKIYTLACIAISLFFVFIYTIRINADIPGKLYIYDNAPGCGLAEEDCILTQEEFTSSESENKRNTETCTLVENNVFPSSINLSEDKFFPPIRLQIGGSCVAWASVYYQFTYEVARLNDWDAKHDDDKVFSPEYVWTYLNDGINNGITFDDCSEFLKEFGCIRRSEFPYEELDFGWYQGDSYNETVTTLRRALETRITNYSDTSFIDYGDVVEGQPIITSYNDSDLDLIKSYLSEGHPLVISTYVNSLYIEETEEFGKICLYQSGFNGGHAMTIVGYDDNVFYDLNEDGYIQDYEKGALLVANSWGSDWGNNGYMWVLYDALNRSSNVEELNVSNRTSFINGYRIRSITVENCEPAVSAEITLRVKSRNDIGIEKARLDNNTTQLNYEYTPFYSLGGNLSPSGGNEYESYVMVVDFYNLMTDEPCNYYLGIVDINADNSNITTIEKIRWIDENGSLIRELDNVGSIDGYQEQKSINCYIPLESITFTNDAEVLYYEEEMKIDVALSPSEGIKDSLIWSSSNEDVATVDSNGVVTYVGPGTTIITATSKDGTNISESCTLTVFNDYAANHERAKNININMEYDAEIGTAYDIDCFSFIPYKDGKYLFRSLGYTDTVVNIYDSDNNLIAQNDDFSDEYYYNFGVICDLQAGEVYYIEVSAYGADIGDYSIETLYAYDTSYICDSVNDGRKIYIEVMVAKVLDTLVLNLDGRMFTIVNPGNDGTYTSVTDDIEISVCIDTLGDGKYTYWDITITIPETEDSSEDISSTFSEEDLWFTLDMM